MKRGLWVLAVCVGAIGVPTLAAVHWDYSGWFAYDPSMPLNARLTPVTTTEYAERYELRLSSLSGEDIVGFLDLPLSPPPHPLIILQGGYHRGRDALTLVGDEVVKRGYALFSMNYRYGGSVDNPVLLYFQVRGAMRDAVLDLRRALDYFETRPDVAEDQIVMVGVSLGALFGPILAAVDGRIDYLALIYGGGDLPKVVRANSPFHPVLTEIMVGITRVVYAPFEPLKYAARISPTPLFMVHGTSDQWVPGDCAREFYAEAGEPKTLIWHEHGHIRAFHADEIMKLVQRCLGWLDGELNRGSAYPGASGGAGSSLGHPPG